MVYGKDEDKKHGAGEDVRYRRCRCSFWKYVYPVSASLSFYPAVFLFFLMSITCMLTVDNLEVVTAGAPTANITLS